MNHPLLHSRESRYVLIRAIVATITVAAFALGAYRCHELYTTRFATDVSPIPEFLEAAPTDPLNAGLVVDADDLEIGDVAESERFEWHVTIRNPTEKPVVIEHFPSSCSKNIYAREPLTVPAQGAVQVPMTLNLTPRDSRSPDPLHESRLSIWPIVAGRVQRGWTIHARSHRAFVLSRDNIDLGAASELDRTVFVTMLRPNMTIDATCNPAVATVTVKSVWGPPRTTYSVKVTPHETKGLDAIEPLVITSRVFEKVLVRKEVRLTRTNAQQEPRHSTSE
jgi:hypothetical protein